MNTLEYAQKMMGFDGRTADAQAAMAAIDESPNYHSVNAPDRMRLVRGIQASLRKMSIRVPDSGTVDTATAAALVSLVGPTWREFSWREIYAKLGEAAYANMAM